MVAGLDRVFLGDELAADCSFCLSALRLPVFWKTHCHAVSTLGHLIRIPIPMSHATKASNSRVSELERRFSNLTQLPFTTMSRASWTFQLDSEAPSKAVPGLPTHRNCEMVSASRFGIRQRIAKPVAKPRTAMDLKKTWPVCLRLELVLFLKNRLSVNMDTRIHVFPFVSKFHFYPLTAA